MVYVSHQKRWRESLSVSTPLPSSHVHVIEAHREEEMTYCSGSEAVSFELPILQDLKSLSDIERERVRATMSVQEYEEFLQRQKELLKSVHDEIKSDIAACP